MYGIGQEHFKAGAYALAVEWFDRVLATNPNECYAYYFKARSLALDGRADLAVDTARRGVAAARSLHDMKAASELSALLDELE